VSRRLLDLSHSIWHGLETYPGLPAPEIDAFLTHADSRARYAPGTEFHIGRIRMVANTGTYLDSPFHRFSHGADLAALPLDRLADLPGLCVDADPGERALDEGRFADLDVKGRAVLVRTGWSRHWGTADYFGPHPYLTAHAARWLADSDAALVGIDSLNIDDTRDATRPVHTALLARGIPVVEHLTGLEALPVEGFRFFAVPVKVEGMGTFPVRAFAIAS